MTENEMKEAVLRIGVEYFDRLAAAVRMADQDPYEAHLADQYAARLDTIYRVYAALELGSEEDAAEAMYAAYEAQKAQEGIDD